MEEISRKRTRLEVPAPAARGEHSQDMHTHRTSSKLDTYNRECGADWQLTFSSFDMLIGYFLLVNLTTPSVPAHADRSLLVNAPTQPPWRDAEPLKDSALLGRLQSFLPAMQKANEELELAAAKEPESCNIESVAQDAPHIEMNLACGVLDLKDDSAAAAAQRAVNLTNSSEALDNLPTLKEDEDVVITEPDFLDMSRAAAGAAGSLMTERASRRIGKADQKHADNSSMGGKTEAPCYLEENEDHSNATLDPQPVPSKPSTSNTGGTSAV